MMVTHVLPYPPAAGNEIRIYRMLQWFRSKGYRISLVLKPLGDEEVSNECITGLHPIVDEIYVFDSRFPAPRCDNANFRKDIAEEKVNLADMQNGFCPPWFVMEINSLVRKIQPDVIISQYIFMSRILLSEFALDTLKIIDTHDLFFKKQETVEKYSIANFGLIMSEDDEASLFKRADILLAIQQLEREDIKRLVPDRTVLLTGFDVDIFHPDPAKQKDGLVLIVASSNEFNVRGTQDFLDYTWPLVQERYPEARLRLVGKVCEHVHTYDLSVEKVGFVHDLAEEYTQASVVVNPCGVGTGLKIKTVEALAWGRPHVGWPASADGLREIAELPYIVAQDIVEFADAVVNLLQDKERARLLGIAAHEFAERYLGAVATYGSLSVEIEAHANARNNRGSYHE
ncbi:glycosyl transferase group 1 [Dickeya parazeae Ech586]|uniref:Glycosyl transferase group 1 n=2 Tax=Dickeya TaxID=204037 RepID=D2BSD5_DICZ5|nr:glycosyl transferase group 1 [Dickeya parazeae Ech586]